MTIGSLDTFPQVQKSFSHGSPTTNSYSQAQYCRLVAKTHNIRVKTLNKWAKEQFIKTIFSSILLYIILRHVSTFIKIHHKTYVKYLQK